MVSWRFSSARRKPRKTENRRMVGVFRQPALLLPLHTLPAPLEHGALGVWDEVAVGALLVGCAVAYAVWFYVGGRGEKPPGSK